MFAQVIGICPQSRERWVDSPGELSEHASILLLHVFYSLLSTPVIEVFSQTGSTIIPAPQCIQ